MREVKADTKGRVTGAEPEKSYVRKEARDGVLTYTPVIPFEFAEVRDVTNAKFEAFFGVPVGQVLADSNMAVPLRDKYADVKYYPHGLIFTRFSENRETEQVLIRILKD